ncbi:acyl-CoA dehydrogenase family protein [Wolbachia endosymbiont of Oedothorax gibbosus]|uniref:acyl-CoA dehydrogenase family protein n=1 Tax=Wolbachia endosymbiont of Oedothorax gibbosus TaxID=931100 RepID=UPI002025136F|nr:acyl-CoA dehydrogenase family protein [Wolbachia endosymbiont of Oedothorax gibbosus]
MVRQKLSKELTSLSPHHTDKKLRLAGMYGLFRHAIDQSHGGNGDSFFDLIAHHKDLGKSTLDSSLLLSINGHLWGALFPIYYFGTTQQKSQYLKPLMDGKLIGGHAITEAQAGSNVSLMKMRADSIDDGFRLNGSKRYITNVPINDILLVYAKTGDTVMHLSLKSKTQGSICIKITGLLVFLIRLWVK